MLDLILAGVSAATSIMGAMSKKDNAGDTSEAEAAATTYQALLDQSMSELDVANVQSDVDNKVIKIRQAALQTRGMQMAQQAASGVVIGDGSAGQMLEQTQNLSNEDVIATMYSGSNKIVSIRANARLNVQAAKNRSGALLKKAAAERNAAQQEVYSTLISSASNLYSASSSFFKPKVPAAPAK